MPTGEFSYFCEVNVIATWATPNILQMPACLPSVSLFSQQQGNATTKQVTTGSPAQQLHHTRFKNSGILQIQINLPGGDGLNQHCVNSFDKGLNVMSFIC